MYRRRVPADFTFNVEVKGSRNEGISASPVSVGPISQNQTLRKDIVVSSCPTLLQAQIVGCDDKPVGGFVQVITPTGVKIASSTTGKILVTVPGGTVLTLEGYSTEGLAFASTPVAAIAAGTIFDAGNLKACNGVTTQYLDIPMPDGEIAQLVALNGDGSRVAVRTNKGLHMYDAATGTKQWTASRGGSSIRFVANGQRAALSSNSGTTVLDASTGQAVGGVIASGQQHITADGSSVYVAADTSGGAFTAGSIVEYDATSGVMRRIITPQTKQFNFIGLQGDNFAIIQRYSPGAILTIDLSTGNVVRTYDGSSDSTTVSESAALSPSGKTIILYGRGSSGTSGGLTAVDLLTGTIISRIQTQAQIMAISWDDAEYVSRMYTQGAMPTLMALRTQQLKRVLPWNAQSQSDMPTAFTFSGDGSRLAGLASGGVNTPPGTGNSRVRVYTLK
jgi:WD40 repeat protein